MRAPRSVGKGGRITALLSYVIFEGNVEKLNVHWLVPVTYRQLFNGQEHVISRLSKSPPLASSRLRKPFSYTTGTWVAAAEPGLRDESLLLVPYIYEYDEKSCWLFPQRKKCLHPATNDALRARYAQVYPTGTALELADQFNQLRAAGPIYMSIDELLDVYAGGYWTVDMVRCVFKRLVAEHTQERMVEDLRDVLVDEQGRLIITRMVPMRREEALERAIMLSLEMLAQVPRGNPFINDADIFFITLKRLRLTTDAAIICPTLDMYDFYRDAPVHLPFPVAKDSEGIAATEKDLREWFCSGTANGYRLQALGKPPASPHAAPLQSPTPSRSNY